jgi:HEAT repeat protein
VRIQLERAVESADLQSRRFALIALAQCAARAGRTSADEAAGEGVAQVRQFLGRRLADGRSHERSWAALALGVLEHGLAHRARIDGRAADARANVARPALGVRAQILAALRDAGSGSEVGALAIAAGLMHEREALPILLAKLERTSEPATLGHLALAIGLVGDVSGTTALRAQLATARFEPDVLRDTAIGLALLEDDTLVPSLVRTLENANSLASQGAAASVLGWIGDRRTIAPLLALVESRDATASARAFAAVALGRVCDRDRMPWNAAVAQDVHYRAATVTLAAGDGTGLLDIL